jgi:single-strand DNA-binding protein
MCSLSLATSEAWKDKNTGERMEQTEWHRVELWDNLANIAEQYLRKGNQVYIEGKIRSEEWQDKNGATVRGYKVRATSINLIGGRNEGSPAATGAAERPKPEAVLAGETKSDPFPPMMEEGDDLPF